MNVKLENCLKDCEELAEKIEKFKDLEQSLSKQSHDFFEERKVKEELKQTKEDIDFLKANIIESLNYCKVESDEDLNSARTCIDLIENMDFNELDAQYKTTIIDSLFKIGDEKYSGVLTDYALERIEQDEGYFNNNSVSLENLIFALHREFETGTSNVVLDHVFGQYYILRELLIDNIIFNEEVYDIDIDHDFGKNVVVSIAQDPKISKKYKDAFKRAYQDYIFDVKYESRGKAGIIAEGVSTFIEAPALAIKKVGELTGKVFSLAGDVVFGATSLLAFPNYKLASRVLIDKEPTLKRKVLVGIVAFPGMAIHIAGAVGAGILKVGGFMVEKSLKLATYPIKLISKGILKAGKVKPKDMRFKYEHELIKNLTKVLKKDGIKVKQSEIRLDNISYYDNSLVFVGRFIDESNIFKISYEVNENVAKSVVFGGLIADALPVDDRGKFREIIDDIFETQSKENAKADAISDEINGKINLVLSNITRQEPIDIEYFQEIEENNDIIDNIYNELEEIKE